MSLWRLHPSFARSRLARAALLALVLSGGGCEKEPCFGSSDLSQCGITCPARGLLDGHTAISGIVAIDAFFAAVVDGASASRGLASLSRTRLDAVAATMGLPNGTSSATIAEAIRAKVAAATADGVRIVATPSRCEISPAAMTLAAASCAVTDGPDPVVACKGSCAIEASAQDACRAVGTLACIGGAPGGSCAGTCTGACALEDATLCDGECQGQCTGECSDTDALGDCRGACAGICKGTCLLAGGACAGQCRGLCTEEPAIGACDPGAVPYCRDVPGGVLGCKGACDGSLAVAKPPSSCAGLAGLLGSLGAMCSEPTVLLTYQLAAGTGPAARAEFREWTGALRPALAALLQTSAQAAVVKRALDDVTVAAAGPVTAMAEVAAQGNLKASIGASCAIDELGNAGALLTTAEAERDAASQSIAEVLAALGP